MAEGRRREGDDIPRGFLRLLYICLALRSHTDWPKPSFPLALSSITTLVITFARDHRATHWGSGGKKKWKCRDDGVRAKRLEAISFPSYDGEIVLRIFLPLRRDSLIRQ